MDYVVFGFGFGWLEGGRGFDVEGFAMAAVGGLVCAGEADVGCCGSRWQAGWRGGWEEGGAFCEGGEESR